MSQIDDTIQVDIQKLKVLRVRSIELGAKIKQMMDTDGFQILKAIFKNFENDTKNEEDYRSLEEFKADRKALKIVRGLLNELDSYVGNAELASAELNKLIEAESSTPSLLSLDGEGMDNEEGQES